MKKTTKKILIQGWRGINHSFAMMSQHQLLAMRSEPRLRIFHKDAPYFMPHWNSSNIAAGFSPEKYEWLASLKEIPSEKADIVYRVAAPLSAPHRGERRTITFAITEFGLDRNRLADPLVNLSEFTQNDNLVVTSTRWSRDRLIDFGFDESAVRVVPLGFDPEVLIPAQPTEKRNIRARIGVTDDEFVFLNIGPPLWNKGVDLLITAFARIQPSYPNTRLMLKDSRALYGLSIEKLIADLSTQFPGMLTQSVLSAISVVSANLDQAQLRSLYCAADCYVSPYRAEGFNLPVLEALACGVPVIVSSGGATDDFCDGPLVAKVPTTFYRGSLPDGVPGCWVNPYQPALQELMVEAIKRGPISFPAAEPASTTSEGPTQLMSWKTATNTLIRLFHDE